MSVRRSLATLALLSLAAAVFGGCTPSPEKTCDKLQELADKEAKSGSKFSLSRTKCLKNLEEMKERDPSAYKCAAKVVAKLDSLDTAMLAISVCDPDKPKKKASKDDDADEKPAKKKASKSDDEDEKPAKKKAASDDE